MPRLFRSPSLPAAVLLGALSTMAPAKAHAGPWTPKSGHGYAKAWLRWLPGFGYNDSAGTTRSYGSYHELTLSFYGEIGLLDSLALTLHAPLLQYFSLKDPRDGRRQQHLLPGDPQLGLRWRLLAGWLTLALEAALRFPLASDKELQQVYADEPEQPEPNARIGALRGGSGVFDFPVGLSLGHSWRDGFLEATVGYIARSGGYKHDIYWSAAGGVALSKRFSGRLRLSGRHPTGAGGDTAGHDSPSGIGNRTSYVGLAIEIDYRIAASWAIGATLEGGLFGLRRQTGGPVLSLSISTWF